MTPHIYILLYAYIQDIHTHRITSFVILIAIAYTFTLVYILALGLAIKY